MKLSRVLWLSSLIGGAGCFLLLFLSMGRGQLILIGLGICVMLALWTYHRMAKSDMEYLSDRLEEMIVDPEKCSKEMSYEEKLDSKVESQLAKVIGISRRREEEMAKKSSSIATLVSDIGHQLKTPLANLNIYMGYLHDETKKREDGDEELYYLSGQVKGQIDKLTWLTEGLTKISKVEAGLVHIERSKKSIQNTILKAIGQAYPMAEKKGIVLEYRCEKDKEIHHDSRWTAEAIFNVIDNGIKYSGAGTTMLIETHCYESFYRIDILDQGPGIDEEEINHIFKRFYRGRQLSDLTEGVGIGLYLARDIVTKQEGYMKVQSKLGQGSRFSIFLPNS